MNTEFEIKFYPVEKDSLRANLESSGAKLELKDSLMKISLFGNTSNKDMQVHYIRVRDEIDKVTLSAKVHAREGEGIHDQKEVQVTVSDFDDTVKILKLSGLNQDYDQEKYREVWTLDECEVVIDTWPDMKPLVEIEGASEARVRSVSEKLGFDWEQGIFTSITEILAKERQMSFDEALELSKKWTFNN